MFARFNENPAMTLQDIKETKRYGRTDAQRENSIPPTKFAGGIITYKLSIEANSVDTDQTAPIWGPTKGKEQNVPKVLKNLHCFQRKRV